MTVDTRTLADEEAEALRDAVTEAVLATPAGAPTASGCRRTAGN
jgi:hypothetical protein